MFFTVITADGLKIRRAEKGDVETIDRLLYQVNNVHSDVRPDLFKANEKKYTDEELFKIIADGQTPVFVAECGGAVLRLQCRHGWLEGDGAVGEELGSEEMRK